MSRHFARRLDLDEPVAVRVRQRTPPQRHEIEARNKRTGERTRITLKRSQNSLGEPDLFAGKRPGNKKEFVALRGFPLYAIQTWLVANGYTYQVI